MGTSRRGGCRAFESSVRGRIAALAAITVLVSGLVASSAARAAGSGGSWNPSGAALSAHEARAARLRDLGSGRANARRRASAAVTAVGTVEGTVTDAVTKEGIEGIEVCAWSLEERESEVPSYVCGESGAGGAYALASVPVGENKVEFTKPFMSKLDYVSQYWEDVPGWEEARPVVVEAGKTVKEIDAAMAHGGGISGVVTVAAGGAPVADALVCAWEAEGESSSCTETEADGEYELTGLAGGDYTVEYFDFPYETEFYDEASTPAQASKVPVTTDKVTPGIDAKLKPAATRPENTVRPTITGTVAVGSTVSCSAGTWTGTAPIEFGFKWLRELVPIEGATGTSYTIQPLDAGHVLWCEVTATNRAGGFWIRVGYRVPVPAPVVTPPAAPAPTVAVLPAKTVVPSLAVLGRATVTGANATVKLRCALGPCHGTLQLLGKITRRVKVHGHTVTRHVTVVLGSGSFTLAQGAGGKARIHLTAAGRRLLASARRHPRTEALKILLAGAATSNHSVSVD